MPIRLAACATHPIQVQVPLYRRLAARPDVDLHVFFASDDNIRPTYSASFGRTVQWDLPLLEGYDHTFLKNDAPMGNTAVEPSMLRRLLVFSAPEIRGLLRRGRFDAVLVPGYSRLFYLQAVRGARAAGAAVLFRGNNRDETGGQRPGWKAAARRVALGRFYAQIDGFLSVGKYMRRHFHDFGIPDSRIFDSPYCVDEDHFLGQCETFLPQRESIRRELGIPQDAVVLLYSGKLTPKKAPLLLAQAFRSLGAREDLYVIVMGDGPLSEAFPREVGEQAASRLRMVGFVNQSEVGRYHAASDALVLCSDFGESWGLVVNEAMLFGRPAIVSDGVGCRDDLIEEGKTGFVFPRGDVEALTERISRWLDRRDLLESMGRAARERIDGYSPDRAVDGIVSALEAHARRPGRSRSTRRQRADRATGSQPRALD